MKNMKDRITALEEKFRDFDSFKNDRLVCDDAELNKRYKEIDRVLGEYNKDFKVLAERYDILSRKLDNIQDSIRDYDQRDNKLIETMRARLSKLELQPDQNLDNVNVLLTRNEHNISVVVNRLETLERKMKAMKKFSLW